ncbi:glucose-1-phosphate adenylyltransferase family protein [Nocardioides sp. zg-DK7169]|uniref:glucose-1-phosphate adenylyltransferase family protein n=1 Tax=Nocardioides sp. zg-DK7169 TaxID=2736600 RepID=UPI0015568F58|nr:sugar phosphate nucleotidyltransferase [Nocardioides sp. zg-DK7169]NPC95703.1 glucose-1-phosphate adenylyltransferase [Nocardioides sp. zg-DK7169]
MPRSRVLAIVQAGGSGGRLDVLTRERAKPALPFAGSWQLVDIPLSNLAHSGITDVWLAVQFQGSSLEEQVANGRPWDLDRSHGGLRLLMPQEGTGTADEEGFAQGNADALYRIRDQVRAAAPDEVVVLSADHVYRLDFTDVLETHRRAGAECTVVTTAVPPGDRAADHAVVQHDEDGRVTRIDYKPEDPAGDTIATEAFVYDREVLIEVLEELHRNLTHEAEEGDTGLGDFGEHLVPRLVERGRTVVHSYDGYWRDLGQPHLYLRAHRDFLTEDHGVLDDPEWPILTRQPQRTPARVLDGGVVVDSLLSPGVQVSGTVRRSVLGPGVVVEAGAEVCDSVLSADTVVRAGARVDWAILDSDCEVEADAVVEGAGEAALDDPDLITLVGRGSVVGRGVRLEPGSRLEPGTTA